MKVPGSASALSQAPAHSPHPARIGPNAIIRTVQALREVYVPAEVAAILERSGRPDLIETLPEAMIAEAEFNSLVQALRSQLGPAQSERILRRSGQLTAVYLLHHRIPRPIQALLKVLPRRAGLKILLSAISKHAWTFVGSGEFRFTVGRASFFTITNCVECRGIEAEAPMCSFYTGAFEHLLRTLIAPRATVQETECEACGANRCLFQIGLN